ncbi:uncharacterized protein LOC120017318 [Tripterygium wilfordii]|uniref:uncharacterized protein LOC120017318 n=1 Tax=Tripterygium wilfordii TaxID=458696 RepID=UPI0018F81F75|nr:uncharacterized protein LOC120017318 [Tripterygium wilfordii]
MSSLRHIFSKSHYSSSPPQHSPPLPASSHWIPPPVGRLKINVDAAWSVINSYAGVGAVVRDANGVILASSFKRIPSAGGSLYAEATAFLFGIELAVALNITSFILEGDALIIVSDLNSNRTVLAPYGSCVDAALLLLQDCHCEIVHTSRSNNQLADSLARHGMNCFDSVMLMGHVPHYCNIYAIADSSI